MKKLILLLLDLMPLGLRTTRLTFVIFALVTLNISGWQPSECVCNALGTLIEDGWAYFEFVCK